MFPGKVSEGPGDPKGVSLDLCPVNNVWMTICPRGGGGMEE